LKWHLVFWNEIERKAGTTKPKGTKPFATDIHQHKSKKNHNIIVVVDEILPSSE
jgi:hypothetical protein